MASEANCKDGLGNSISTATQCWLRGRKVRGNSVASGTAIGSFLNTEAPCFSTSKPGFFGHAMILVSQITTGVTVFDQFIGPGGTPRQRFHTWTGLGLPDSLIADNYYVIAESTETGCLDNSAAQTASEMSQYFALALRYINSFNAADSANADLVTADAIFKTLYRREQSGLSFVAKGLSSTTSYPILSSPANFTPTQAQKDALTTVWNNRKDTLTASDGSAYSPIAFSTDQTLDVVPNWTWLLPPQQFGSLYFFDGSVTN